MDASRSGESPNSDLPEKGPTPNRDWKHTEGAAHQAAPFFIARISDFFTSTRTSENNIMDLIKNWKIHLLALIICVIAEMIGVIRLGLVVMMPLLYALIIGSVVSYPKLKVLKLPEMERAAQVLGIGMLILITKIGLDIGPNIKMIMDSGLALLMQEFGHFFGTLIFGLPVAILVGMRREAIGACYSIDREANVAIIAERFGLASPEGRGVMGMYICGTVFGALWVSVLAGIIAQLGIFHPHSLAMGAGIGSASMMAAGTASIIGAHPEAAETIRAYAAAANLLTSVLGIYFALFISLPVTIRVYEWAARVFYKNRGHENQDAAAQAVAVK